MLDNLSDNDGVSKVLTKELKCGDIAYGMYGQQKGDGTATITNTLQIDKTADYIYRLISE